MLAVECCIKSNGFASLDADELFFINGGSGASEGISHTTVGGIPITISNNHGTITFNSKENYSNNNNCQITIHNNYGSCAINVNTTSNNSSGGGSAGGGK